LSLLGWLIVSSVLAAAAEPTASLKTGKLSTVQLLPVSRLEPKSETAAPDGLTFHFVVTRKPDAGPLALKETRDLLLGGESYQAKTKAELGRQFEPGTEVNTASTFFVRHRPLARFAPEDANTALVISVSIGGARLFAGTSVEVTLNVGAAKQVEPFTFNTVVPEK